MGTTRAAQWHGIARTGNGNATACLLYPGREGPVKGQNKQGQKRQRRITPDQDSGKHDTGKIRAILAQTKGIARQRRSRVGQGQDRAWQDKASETLNKTRMGQGTAGSVLSKTLLVIHNAVSSQCHLFQTLSAGGNKTSKS